MSPVTPRTNGPVSSSLLLLAALAACDPPRSPDLAVAPVARTAVEDHADMMRRLGIRALRPGPSGDEGAPNHANYDEAKATPFTTLPDPLVTKAGRRVTDARGWAHRRAEIVEDFEREVYGRIPRDVPAPAWRVAATDTGTIGGRRVVGRQLVGRVESATAGVPAVEISVALVLPADAPGPAPVMIMFRRGSLGLALGRPAPADTAGPMRFWNAPPAPGSGVPRSDAPALEQLVADGWGVAWLDPVSVQADDGAGLTRGIIGLANRGQPRAPDQWGALRAWGWGASRLLDHLETDRAVDATRVGIEGVSRFGKAALVTMAFDPRFAVALVGSSGKGGTTLHRRNFGEAVESLASSGEYHWMAGSYLKYAASDATFGSMTANDLPVDSHELLALCAPRPVFVSYGIPEKGDARWLDQRGSWMAAIAAGSVYRLLGARDLGVGDDWANTPMPPVSSPVVGGQLAWRQHDGGHTDAPNWKHFLPWIDAQWARTYTPPAPRAVHAQAVHAQEPTRWPADRATPRTDSNSMLAHRQLLAKRTQGRIDVYFMGNSITRRWGATDYPQFLANWRENFHGWNAADFGWGADRIEHMLWRIENGELDGVNPKVIVLLAGTNNVGRVPGGDEKVADIGRGLRALVDLMRRKAPNATVVLTGIFPREDSLPTAPAINAEIARINQGLAAMADGRAIRYVNVNDRLTSADGRLRTELFMDALHPNVRGYQVWADALRPVLTELLGPRASVDHAPPPTGDPSAANRRP